MEENPFENILFKGILFCLIFLVVLPGFTSATQFVSTGAYNFRQGELLDDDLFMTGDGAKISGDIRGNFIAACRSAVINGNIYGSIFCFDMSTKVFGYIGGSMTAMCYEAQLNGQVERNVLVFGNSFNFGPEGRVGRDINAYGAEVIIEGRVGNDLFVEAEEVIISGTIAGNVNIRAHNITLLPTAVIKGNFNYESDRAAKVEDGATILGATEWSTIDKTEEKGTGRRWIAPIAWVYVVVLMISIVLQFVGLIFSAFSGGGIIGIIFLTIASYLALVLIIAVSQNHARKAVEVWKSHPLKSGSLGLVGFVLLPTAAVFFTAIIIGIPTALLIVFVFGLLGLLGWLFSALAIGNLILSGFSSKKAVSLYGSALIGVIILVLSAGIPYLGAVISFLAVFFGMGAVILTRYQLEKDQAQESED